MKLYATVTSERASKGQGGNQRLNIHITLEDGKVNAGHIEVKEIEPNVYNICYIKNWENISHIARIVTKNIDCGCKPNEFMCLRHSKEKGKKQKDEKCEICDGDFSNPHNCI